MTTLNGATVTRMTLQLPAVGVWWADIELDNEADLSGAATLATETRTFVGTIVAGGPYQGRSRYRVAGGAGAWGRSVAAKGYANDAGVKVSTVANDAARDVGETLESPPNTRLRAHFTRVAGPASAVLYDVAPDGWHVGDDGVTRLALREATTYDGEATLQRQDRDAGVEEYAADTLAGFSPGVTMPSGLVASDIEIEQTLERFNVRVFEARRAARVSGALSLLIKQLLPDFRWLRVVEYRVHGQDGERLNLQPVRAALGYPALSRVPVRYGLPGVRHDVDEGSLVLVAWVDGDAGRPVVVGFDDPDSAGWTPSVTRLEASSEVTVEAPQIKLGEGAAAGVARLGDTVVAGPYTGTITSASSKVLSE